MVALCAPSMRSAGQGTLENILSLPTILRLYRYKCQQLFDGYYSHQHSRLNKIGTIRIMRAIIFQLNLQVLQRFKSTLKNPNVLDTHHSLTRQLSNDDPISHQVANRLLRNNTIPVFLVSDKVDKTLLRDMVPNSKVSF